MTDDDLPPLSRRQLLQASAATLTALSAIDLASPAAAAAGPGTTVRTPAGETSAAGLILRRLRQHGCTTLFGVPGKTCEALYFEAAREGMQLCVTASDLEAGYAADGYARRRGLGAVAVTYGVGTLSLVNAIAGAYAERSPVVVVNGGPSDGELRNQNARDVRFTHSIGRLSADGIEPSLTDLQVFRQVTAFARRVTSAASLAASLDEAIATAIRRQRPVYLEVARNVWSGRVAAPADPLRILPAPSGNETAIARQMLEQIGAAQRPMVLVGIEVGRCGLADAVTQLIGRLGLPWASTLLSKSVLAETTPGFMGVYESQHAPRALRQAVRDSDLIVGLGTVLGTWHGHLVTDPSGDPSERLIRASDGTVRAGSRTPRPADLGALVAALDAGPWSPSSARRQALRSWRDKAQLTGLSFDQRRGVPRTRSTAEPARDPGMTYDELMGTVSDFLDPAFVTITDTSLSIYQAADLDVRARNAFLCNAIWQSIGYSVGAAVGVGIAERDGGGTRRPLVICGDGGFQMMAQGLSTMARQRIRGIVVIIDNGMYGIEQHLIDPSFYRRADAQIPPFIALQRWRYADLAKAMGFQLAEEVDTQARLEAALRRARAAAGPALISARVMQRNRPSELQG